MGCKKQLSFLVNDGANTYTHYLSVSSETNFGQDTHNATALLVSSEGGLITITVNAVADWKAIEAFQAAYNTLMGDSQLALQAVTLGTVVPVKVVLTA